MEQGNRRRRCVGALTALVASLALGLLEAAWTRPEAGGPRDAILGCFAIFVVLLIVTWPKPWWILALAILEEATQGYVGTLGAWHPTLGTILDHWSVGVVDINLYPWLLFPTVSVACEILYQKRAGIRLALEALRVLYRPEEWVPPAR